MKIGAIGIRTKIIVGDAATWYLVKKYIDGKVGGGIDDVPEELKKYVRVLGSWVDVTEDLASIENKVDKELGSSLVPDTEIDKLSEYPEFEDLEFSHENLIDKNSEAAFQHVDTTVTKEALDEADKVPLYDSVTGNVVLTPKENLGSDNLIASYTHSGNKEVTVTAVDLATGVFTAVGHGLTNGVMQINPVLNKNVVGVYPLQIFPTRLIPGTLMLAVINRTDNTFQVSSDGVNPLTFSAEGDLTKWHFEKIIQTPIHFTGLNVKSARIVINGGFGRPNLVFIYVNDINTNYIRTGNTSLTGGAAGSWFTNIADGNNIYLMSKIEIYNGNYGFSIYAQSSKKNINTSQPAQIVTVDETFNIFNPQNISAITKLSIVNGFINNGTEIKIYSL